MNYSTVFKDSQTGQTTPPRQYSFEFNEFWWTEGNFGCDCNRTLEFQRALGLDEEECPPCNDGTNRYLVRITDANGMLLYSEFEP